MPKILLVEDNEMNRDMLSRRVIGGVEWILPKPAYDRKALLREVACLLGASVARGAPPGDERLR